MIRGPCPWPYETNVHQMSNTAHSTFPFDPVDLFLSFRTLYSKQKWLSSCTGKEMLRDGIILFLLPRLSQTLSARLYARVLSLYYYDSLASTVFSSLSVTISDRLERFHDAAKGCSHLLRSPSLPAHKPQRPATSGRLVNALLTETFMYGYCSLMTCGLNPSHPTW